MTSIFYWLPIAVSSGPFADIHTHTVCFSPLLIWLAGVRTMRTCEHTETTQTPVFHTNGLSIGLQRRTR